MTLLFLLQSAWGHSSSTDRATVTATWNAPALDEGPIEFKYASKLFRSLLKFKGNSVGGSCGIMHCGPGKYYVPSVSLDCIVYTDQHGVKRDIFKR